MQENHPAPRVINTNKYADYPPAIQAFKAEGVLAGGCEHRAVKSLNLAEIATAQAIGGSDR